MLSKTMQDALNAQINRELFSSYLYLSMAGWCEAQDLPGFANWMFVQAKEELLHVEKFYRYLIERDGTVELRPIEGPQTSWDSTVDVFAQTLDHERFVTKNIHDLVDLATSERDHATLNFLQWFVAEQVEEEASAKAVLQKVKMIGSAPGGLFMLDRELAARVFTPPAATGA
jgi:ferritin